MRFLAALLFLMSTCALAAPDADLWKRWTAHDENSTATIDHAPFGAFLEEYVVVRENAPNAVRYGAVSAADREQLQSYIERMEDVKIAQYHRDVQRAYWTNLYNAATLELVLEHYPVDSIRDIGGGLFSGGPWDEPVVTVDGAELTLNDIEHRILRPIWHDGLTHYGVNSASISCPDLLPIAYTDANIHDKLRANAHAYVNSPQGVAIEDDRLTVSKIYDWYQADFGGNVTGVISHLRQYATPDLSARLDVFDDIDAYVYDWGLNDAAELTEKR